MAVTIMMHQNMYHGINIYMDVSLHPYKTRYLIQIVSNGNDLNDMSNLIFCQKS